jgi:hypothetical protein
LLIPPNGPNRGITGRLENADVQHNASDRRNYPDPLAVYQWTARLGALGVAQMQLMARYWQGVLGITALAAGSWLAWLTV